MLPSIRFYTNCGLPPPPGVVTVATRGSERGGGELTFVVRPFSLGGHPGDIPVSPPQLFHGSGTVSIDGNAIILPSYSISTRKIICMHFPPPKKM